MKRVRERDTRRLFAAWLPVLILVLAVSACGGKPEAADEAPAGEADHGLVTLTPEQQRAAGVETAVAERRAMAQGVEVTGVIQAVPDRSAQVGSRVAGRIASVAVNTGDAVRAGDVLAVVDAPELGRAKADYIAAIAAAEVAQQTAAREQRLYQQRISSEREWREAEAAAARAVAERQAAEARLHSLGLSDDDLATLAVERHYGSTFEVRSPLTGVVADRRAIVGQTVEPTDALFTVLDLREVWALVDVYDEQLAALRQGQPVSARTRAWPERRFAGHVASIGAVLDSAARTLKVRVVLHNSDGALRPGMFVDAEITAGQRRDSLLVVVPAAALQRDGGEMVVFVARGDGRYERRVVEPGTVTREWAAIRAGLAEGERVVTRGAFVIKSEFRRGELGEGDEQ
jgi:cobalt-zinc-cadmium efflux system membrane fusion protein